MPAPIRERQGCIDEAIALLRTRDVTRTGELRANSVTEELGYAAQCLAELLEERDDVEGAIAVYWQAVDSSVRQGNMTVQLPHLLARHGRRNKAIEVMRALADSPGEAEDWILHVLCTLYTDQGRSEDGLAYLDALKERREDEE
ncbi:hypothetical protein [Streptomyces sp. NPDC059468]|uniref:hypothetical protein n=1 Tax=Streptomyces sp. NPDC059468 TaxID=3346845 RepID=UPI0036942944